MVIQTFPDISSDNLPGLFPRAHPPFTVHSCQLHVTVHGLLVLTTATLGDNDDIADDDDDGDDDDDDDDDDDGDDDDDDDGPGPFLLTLLLLDLLMADKSSRSRVINVSSSAHRRAASINRDDVMLTQRDYQPSFIQYPHSKLANVLFTRELARRLGQYMYHQFSSSSGSGSDGISGSRSVTYSIQGQGQGANSQTILGQS